jgi:UDP-glucose 4-epimerase
MDDVVDVYVFGLGAVSLRELVETMIELAGRGSYSLAPFPPERKAIDIGDFWGDATRIHQALGWRPRVPLREGLQRTIEYYREHKEHYL